MCGGGGLLQSFQAGALVQDHRIENHPSTKVLGAKGACKRVARRCGRSAEDEDDETYKKKKCHGRKAKTGKGDVDGRTCANTVLYIGQAGDHGEYSWLRLDVMAQSLLWRLHAASKLRRL